MDGVEIRHHAGVIAVVIPCLGRVDMKIPQLPAQTPRRKPLKRVLFQKPLYLVWTLLLDLFDGMIAVFANGLLTDGHAVLLAVSLIHLTEVLPVLLIVFLCPEPPVLDLFRGEFFSFHGGKSSLGLVVEEMIFPVKDTMKLRNTEENPANILGFFVHILLRVLEKV